MKFSIIIVTFNRKKTLMQCLESIKAQGLKESHEVLVVLNGDLAYLEKYKNRFRDFCFLHIPFTTTANARNIALKKSRGEYVLFLNEDSILPENYFKNIDFNLEWDVLGGPDLHLKNATSLELLIGRALASPLCMGQAFKRHSGKGTYDFHATEESLTIANLWFKKSLFTVDGFTFDKQLFKNEDYYLLTEIAERNKVFHYDPELSVYHQRPQNMEKLGAAFIKSGKYRAYSFLKNPKKEKLMHLIPLIFTLFFSYMIFHPNTFFLALILFYSLAICLYDLINYKSLSPRLVLLHFLANFCFGIGSAVGIWNGLKDHYKNFFENKSLINESRSK